jgi:ATP-dependent Clp protease ATP-binding subunit ClpA
MTVFERFAKDARQCVIQAQEECRQLGHPKVDAVHLLLGLAHQGDGPGALALREHGLDADDLRQRARRLTGPGAEPLDGDALASIGIDLDEVRRTVEARFGTGALDREKATPKGHIPFDRPAKKLLELALREAIVLKHRGINGGHILLGVLRAGDDNTALLVLTDAGIDPADLRETTTRLIEATAA